MRKVYKKLLKGQKERGVIYSSTLSKYRSEMQGDTTHEVFRDTPDKWVMIGRLKDDKFFNNSSFRYNIIRS